MSIAHNDSSVHAFEQHCDKSGKKPLSFGWGDVVVQVLTEDTASSWRCSRDAFIVASQPLGSTGASLDQIFRAILEERSPKTVAQMLHSNVAAVFGTFCRDGAVIGAVRDRRGYSSLYTASCGDGSGDTLFGTHPEEIAKVCSTQPNVRALVRYTLLKYHATHGGRESFWEGIKLVPPATVTVLRNSGSESVRYWSFPRRNEEAKSAKVEPEDVRRHVTSAVVDALSKKPGIVLGLSGGMDSTVVASIMAEQKIAFKAITAEYATSGTLEEASLAGDVARRLKVDWEAVTITPSTFLDRWITAYSGYSAPLSASTEIAFDILMGAAATMGAGSFVIAGSSDQLFAGNHPEFLYNLADLIGSSNFEPELRMWIAKYGTDEFPKSPAKFYEFAAQRIDFSEIGRTRTHGELLTSNYVTPESIAHITAIDAFDENCGSYLRTFMAYTYWKAYVQPARLGLRYQAALHQIEVVDPFTSDALFDWAWELPNKSLIRDGVGKWILRRAFESALPAGVIHRDTKVGFDVPFATWMTEDLGMREFIASTLNFGTESIIEGYIDFRKLRRDYLNRRPLPAMLVWQACNAVMWLQGKPSR